MYILTALFNYYISYKFTHLNIQCLVTLILLIIFKTCEYIGNIKSDILTTFQCIIQGLSLFSKCYEPSPLFTECFHHQK